MVGASESGAGFDPELSPFTGTPTPPWFFDSRPRGSNGRSFLFMLGLGMGTTSAQSHPTFSERSTVSIYLLCEAAQQRKAARGSIVTHRLPRLAGGLLDIFHRQQRAVVSPRSVDGAGDDRSEGIANLRKFCDQSFHHIHIVLIGDIGIRDVG